MISLKLAERGSRVGEAKLGLWVREVRKLNANGHQTSEIDAPLQEGTDVREPHLSLAQILRLIPEDALLLVIGGSNPDQRTLSLINGHANRRGEVLWIHDRDPAARPKKRKRESTEPTTRCFVNYAIPARFLDEWYCWSRSSHPVLHRANAYMLEADFRLRNAQSLAGSDAVESVTQEAGIAEKLFNDTRATLKLARQALCAARGFLLNGRPNVWWWSWLCQLTAQWWHEWIALSFDSPYSEDWPMKSAEMENQAPDQDETRSLMPPLVAIRNGLEFNGGDIRRSWELEILWWQFLFCELLRESNAADKHRAGETVAEWSSAVDPAELTYNNSNWAKMNLQAGLEKFTSQLGFYGDDVYSKWKALSNSSLDDSETKRFCTLDSSLRNALLEVETFVLEPILSAADDAVKQQRAPGTSKSEAISLPAQQRGRVNKSRTAG